MLGREEICLHDHKHSMNFFFFFFVVDLNYI